MTAETKTEARERMSACTKTTNCMLVENHFGDCCTARSPTIASLLSDLSALRAEHQETVEALALMKEVAAQVQGQRDEALTKLSKIDHQHEMCPCGGLKWTSCRICAHTADCRGCPDCQQAAARPWVRPEEYDKAIAERDAEMRAASYARSLLADAQAEAASLKSQLAEAQRERDEARGGRDCREAERDHWRDLVMTERATSAGLRAALAASEEKARRLVEALTLILNYPNICLRQQIGTEIHDLALAALSSPSADPVAKHEQCGAVCSEAGTTRWICGLERDHEGQHSNNRGHRWGSPSAGPASEAKLCPHCDSPYENSAPCTCLSATPASEGERCGADYPAEDDEESSSCWLRKGHSAERGHDDGDGRRWAVREGAPASEEPKR